MNIRKGDEVIVISGPERGKRGRILRVLRKQERLVIEGVKMIKKHQRGTERNTRGGIVKMEGSVHRSNVMPWCASANKPSKIAMRRLNDGSRARVYVINGETLNEERGK